MENNFTPEQIEKVKAARSPKELLSLAKESGLELSEEQANAYFDKLNKSGDLSDDELTDVSGGGCRNKHPHEVSSNDTCDNWICKNCGKNGGGERHKHGAFYVYRNCDGCKFCYYDTNVQGFFCSHPAKN